MGTLTMVAESVNGTLVGGDQIFGSVSTDTRTLKPGQLFFALQGEHFDAAEFVDEAARRGAAGAVVEHRQTCDLSQIEVGNARYALGALAKDWRSRFTLPVIAVTGSNGKTTVKEMIASILSIDTGDAAALLVTSGNLNNDIGLPLTVLRLRARHRVAVLEMGASHQGEIAYLAGIAAPDIGVVTNAGAAHLEGFGSEAVVAATKGELFASLSADGVAVVNRDDQYFDTWTSLAGSAEVRSFGLSDEADYRATEIEEVATGESCALTFVIEADDRTAQIRLPMAGRHNVRNALAAAAAARAAGASWLAVQQGLALVNNVPGRLRAVTGRCGATIYDDTYNANPVSVRAAIDFLADREGETWLVLGDMAELGADSPDLHRDIGRAAKESGVSRLFCVGDQSRVSAEVFGDGGQWFGSLDALADALGDALGDAIGAKARREVTILVKGSRCMGLEKLVARLQANVQPTERDMG